MDPGGACCCIAMQRACTVAAPGFVPLQLFPSCAFYDPPSFQNRLEREVRKKQWLLLGPSQHFVSNFFGLSKGQFFLLLQKLSPKPRLSRACLHPQCCVSSNATYRVSNRWCLQSQMGCEAIRASLLCCKSQSICHYAHRSHVLVSAHFWNLMTFYS